MESFERNKRAIRNFVIIIIIAGLAVGGYFAYNYHMEKTNTEKFINYLTTQGYKKEKGGLIIKNTDEASYYLSKNESMISKMIIFEEDDINYTYHINPYENTVEIILDVKGTFDNIYGYSEQKMIYNKDTKEYKCEILSNKNFPSMCKEIKKELDIYNDEVKELIEKSGTKEKYILNKF